jgi:putative ABC transport system substrate-binding protein
MNEIGFRRMELTARSLGVVSRRAAVRQGDELDSAFSSLVKARADALVITDDPMLNAHARGIAALAAKHRLPTAASLNYVQAGSLLSYGPDFVDFWRRAAIFADKILKGAKPADLPVEQPTRFELVVNLKTASALGLTIPRSVLSIADQVIK